MAKTARRAGLLAGVVLLGCARAALSGAAEPRVVLPMDRTAYFVGELVPVAVPGDAELTLDAEGPYGTVVLYRGGPGNLLLDTSGLAPGAYSLSVDGAPTGSRFVLASALRRSAGSMQDECLPGDAPDISREERKDPEAVAGKIAEYRGSVASVFRESGLSAAVSMAVCEMGRRPLLDAMAEVGALLLVNPDTRPTSFCPVHVDPVEIDGMSQRMILTAQANGRHPNFGGFCFGWDTTGFRDYSRKMLLIYWGWGDQVEPLRRYVNRQQEIKALEFERVTGLKAVTFEEYVTYLLSIGRPEIAPFIDMPTREWMREIAAEMKPLPEAARARLEERVDAYSQYLMTLYDHAYSRFAANLRGVAPAMRHTSSVQVDHCPVLYGQYFPSAYDSLDLMYQSTWNDQVGGPDYSYQWLFTQGLLDMHRRGRPTWISNAFGAVHARSDLPGKFVRVAAHGLAYGASGIGFAHEAFSNLLGGMNRGSTWANIRGTAGGFDVLAGRDFLDRFAALALYGRGDHGVGVLFSKSQLSRQCIAMGFGTPQFNVFVTLARLGYTPRYVTEEELAQAPPGDVKALVVVTQSVPLPWRVMASLDAFVRSGGRVLVDGNTIARLSGAERLDLTVPFTMLGKPHNMGSPNLPAGDNDALMFARIYKEMAPPLAAALGATGRGVLASDRGAEARISLLQIDGGADAKYVVAVNDSHVRSQADWHQLVETLVPQEGMPAGATLYDCTEEEEIGPAGRVVCDVSATTARVYAVLPRPLRRPGLAATQRLKSGEELRIAVEFLANDGRPLEAVLPFHLELARPDGAVWQDFHRSTDQKGVFTMAVRMPVNAPAGRWSVRVRSQLDGQVAALPVDMAAAGNPAPASLVEDPVWVRGREAVSKALAPGARFVLPVFGTPNAEALLPVARRLKEACAKRGVEVAIIESPEMATYWLAYDPTEDQRRENERVDRGEAMGRIKRTTVNHNDWYSGMSGYRSSESVILLDLAGEKDNEMAERLDGLGMLWPEVSGSFPGPGRAVVQCVPWAFAPRRAALVIQAADVEGLSAGVDALGALPEDRLTPSVRAARAALWREYHVGGRPKGPEVAELGRRGLRVSRAPRPFGIRFTDKRPLPENEVPPLEPYVHPAHAVPGVITPKQYVPYDFADGAYVETSTAGVLLNDLRFSKSLKLVLDVREPRRTQIAGDGTFRYSDKEPRSQAQWEELLALRKKYVALKRQPMEIELWLACVRAGALLPTRTGERDMPVETLPWYAKEKPKSVREEVVLELAGELELPAGRHELVLVHRNIVDGYLNRVRIGVSAAEADAIQKQAEEELKLKKAAGKR